MQALPLLALFALPLGVNGLFGFGGGSAEKTVPSHDKYGCVSWRQTGNCSPDGPREPRKDKKCLEIVMETQSGYCECAWGRVEMNGCRHNRVQCARECMVEFPSGGEGDGEMGWFAGSKWQWNNWREVEFKEDGKWRNTLEILASYRRRT
jgi:hypothetical protein